MSISHKESKTFFSQMGPPTLLGGMFVLLGLGLFSITLWEKGFSGLQKGQIFGFALTIILGIALWLCFCWRIRFERDYATIYYCTIFPVRINYAEIIRLSYFHQKHKKQEVPAVIYFHLSSGTVKSWNINVFSAETAKAVKNELESRISPLEDAAATLPIPDIQLWANWVLHSNSADKILCCAGMIFLLLFGFLSMCSQLAWNDYIKNWDKVDGVILKNTSKKVRSGKSYKRVADVEYQYTYKKRIYRGNRIVYDSKSFPDLKVGKKRQVIVNPENPQKSAIMFWYRGHWGMIRWGECAFFYLVGLILAISFFRMVSRKEITVPAALKSYISSISPERFHAALAIERPAVSFSEVEMKHKMEYPHAYRYGVIQEKTSPITYIVFGVLLLLSVAVALIIPLCWIVVIGIGFVFYSSYAPKVKVFDFQEKKLFSGKCFHPETAAKMKSVSFSGIDHLSCVLLRRNGSRFVGIFAVKPDGTNIPICKVSRNRLDLLLELLPELASKMGNLPITF